MTDIEITKLLNNCRICGSVANLSSVCDTEGDLAYKEIKCKENHWYFWLPLVADNTIIDDWNYGRVPLFHKKI